MADGFYTCSVCSKSYQLSISLSDYGKTVAMMSCRSCGLTICADCGDWDTVQYSTCPGCGARALWESNGAVPV